MKTQKIHISFSVPIVMFYSGIFLLLTAIMGFACSERNIINVIAFWGMIILSFEIFILSFVSAKIWESD
jgi:hypothetical protein